MVKATQAEISLLEDFGATPVRNAYSKGDKVGRFTLESCVIEKVSAKEWRLEYKCVRYDIGSRAYAQSDHSFGPLGTILRKAIEMNLIWQVQSLILKDGLRR